MVIHYYYKVTIYRVSMSKVTLRRSGGGEFNDDVVREEKWASKCAHSHDFPPLVSVEGGCRMHGTRSSIVSVEIDPADPALIRPISFVPAKTHSDLDYIDLDYSLLPGACTVDRKKDPECTKNEDTTRRDEGTTHREEVICNRPLLTISVVDSDSGFRLQIYDDVDVFVESRTFDVIGGGSIEAGDAPT